MTTIAIVNGSPRGAQGSTGWILERLVKGIEAAGGEARHIPLAGKRIHHCSGELACWFKTPNVCIHKDDVAEIVREFEGVDSLVLATPVYVDGMTGLLKNFLDRLVVMADPHIELHEGFSRHTLAGAGKGFASIALVSGCGFPERSTFDPLIEHVQAICRNFRAKYAGAVLRPAAPLFPALPLLHPLFFRVRAVSKAIERAGYELATYGRIEAETTEAAAKEVLDRRMYLKQANRSFDQMLKKLK